MEALLSYEPGMVQLVLSAGDTSCGGEKYEHNNECQGSHRAELVKLVALFLEDWELGRVALSCHMATDLLCQELRDACWWAQCQRSSRVELSQQQSLSLEWDVVREKRSKNESATGPLKSERACWYPS